LAKKVFGGKPDGQAIRQRLDRPDTNDLSGYDFAPPRRNLWDTIFTKSIKKRKRKVETFHNRRRDAAIAP
jgi:hypothetical protein